MTLESSACRESMLLAVRGADAPPNSVHIVTNSRMLELEETRGLHACVPGSVGQRPSLSVPSDVKNRV